MEYGRGQGTWYQSTLMLWVLPLVLWALATGFYGFALGKYSDDWSQSFINPSDGSVDAAFHPWVRWPYWFRPVYFMVIWGINTAFWEQDWARHAICALVHLGAGVLLYRVLRTIGIAAGPTVGAATVFLVWPGHGEAVLWPAAIGLPMGAMAVLACFGRAVSFARQFPDGKPWGRAMELGAWTFLAACCHEQAAAATAGIGMLYLACCDEEQAWKLRVRRAVLATAGCGAGCVLYVLLMRVTVPAGRRGSGGSMMTAADAPMRVEQFARRCWDWVCGERAWAVVVDGGVSGARAVLASPLVWAWGSFVLAGVVLWVMGLAGSWGQRPAMARRRVAIRTVWLTLFGLTVAGTSLLPVLVTRNNAVASRYFYVVTLGLVWAGAAGADALVRWMERRGGKSWRLVAGALMLVTVAIGVWGALGMVWWQGAFRTRAEMDRTLGEQLRWLVARPEKGAVVVPVSIAKSRMRGAGPFPEGPVPGALAQPWACWCFVQKTYGRGDMSATSARPGERPLLTVSPAGLWSGRGVCDAWGRGDAARSMIPWEKLVPISIDADGQVHLLTREVVEEILRGGGAVEGDAGKD